MYINFICVNGYWCFSFQTEGKFKSRPDSGIAVSMSSGSYSSYSSSEATKEPRDDIDEACHTESSDIFVDRIENVRQTLLSLYSSCYACAIC